MKTNRVSSLLPVLALGIGCSSSSSAPNTPIKIAYITSDITNPVYAPGREGADDAAKQLSTTDGRNISIVHYDAAQASAALVIPLVQQAVDAKVNGIIMNVNDALGLVDPINQAVSKGIPVMTFDNDAPTSQRMSYLSVDNNAGGVQAARLLAKALNNTGKVAIISGHTDALNLNDRINGFLSEVARTQSMQVVAKLYCDADPTKCVTMVENQMTQTPDIVGWFFVGGWPLTAKPTDPNLKTAMPQWEAAVKAGKMKTVVFNNTAGPTALLQQGLLTALIGQKFYQWGNETTTNLVNYLVNGKAPPAFIDTGYDIICPNNVNVMADIWTNKTYNATVPPCDMLQ